jgi:Phage minor capsid protein 2
MSISRDADRLAAMFADVERYIEELVAYTVLKNPHAASLLFWRRRAQLVHGQIAVARRQLLRAVPDLVTEGYTAGRTLPGIAREVSPEVQQAFGAGMHGRAMAMLAANMTDKLDMALVTVGRRVDDAFRRAGLRAVSYHIAAGTDVEKAARQMEQQLRRDGTRAFVDKAGRQWSLRNYTRMVIRTTTREAVSQGTYNGMQEFGHELIKVSHHVKSCDICLPFDGHTFSLPNASPEMRLRYPVVKQIPPYHPNCRHLCGPASDEFDLMEARLLAKYGASA